MEHAAIEEPISKACEASVAQICVDITSHERGGAARDAEHSDFGNLVLQHRKGTP